jgi:uncharacterized membrane protein YeaQ/YmgE (transglycosylase-associated protein family)
MGWIGSIIVGGIIGWLASIVMKTNAQMGLIANVVVGIVGSALGFWIAGLVGLSAGGGLASWLVSLVGAVVLIFLLRVIGIFR